MRKLLVVCLVFVVPFMLSAADVFVTDDITSDATWTSDNTYFLDGLIFVDSLVTLTIQAGTVIKGLEASSITTGDGASALIIRRGAMIDAQGSASNPIIFTSEFDDVTDPNDLLVTDRELWGGLILLGRATTNQPTTQNQIEGIPLTENARYGGNDDNDNSGILRYISIRHGGFSISGVPGDEINGLTMGAVGSQTTIEYIEVFANFDDGYEWFGGTVNTKHLVAAFCGDDCFDYDQGFRGKHQFWFSLQGTDEAGRGGEHDGGDDDETGTPYAIPIISNNTYIGAGISSSPGGDNNDRCVYFRDNAGGKYFSSIFTDFVGIGIKVEDLTSGDDSRIRMEQGDLVLSNNIWFDFGAGSDWTALTDTVDWLNDSLIANNNQIIDPEIAAISRQQNGLLDPRPSGTGPAATGATQPADPFFTNVPYYGAFAPYGPLWTDGWTAISSMGISTGIEETKISNGIPVNFQLSQNYPNPFNPSTKIEYNVPKQTQVTITVYNVTGQHVETLVNGIREAGNYQVVWNADKFASGVYFYRLEAGSVVEMKKMMLMK